MTLWNPNKNLWDDDPIVTPVDFDVEREKHGYKILTDKIIKCADCGKELVEIIKVAEDKSQVKIVKVACPCGGESFLYEIQGHTYIQATPEYSIKDITTDFADEQLYMTVIIESNT